MLPSYSTNNQVINMMLTVSIDAEKLTSWAKELSVRGMRNAIRRAVDKSATAARRVKPYANPHHHVRLHEVEVGVRLPARYGARARNLLEVYNAVFRRMCQFVGSENDDSTDPLVKDFFETLAAYEQLLTEKNGKTQRAHRTRQKISNKGVYQSLVEWTRGKIETEGFKLLVEAGLPDFTGEYLVARHAERFPEDVVSSAHERLKLHNIPVPELRSSSSP